jgi:hypothetical protein
MNLGKIFPLRLKVTIINTRKLGGHVQRDLWVLLEECDDVQVLFHMTLAWACLML